MTTELLAAGVASIADAVRRREISAREVVGAALEAIDAGNGSLNAFVAVDAERALRDATLIDETIAAGRDVGALCGVPIGVKDLEDAEGFVTTKGSPAFASGPPAARDSVLVQRLKAAGCVVVGKTNTPELGWKGDTENRVFGATRNPLSTAHSPGGSSGGSAAAVAGGLVPLATASDGGGSIRIPASCCGIAGFKPSLGRVPAGDPTAPDWGHLSTRGPLARTVADTVRALDAVLGPHPADLRSLPMPDVPWSAAIEDPQLPVKVGWSPTLGYATVDRQVLDVCRRAVDRIADLGVEVVEIDTVFPADPGLAWVTMTSAYNARTLGHLDGTEAWSQIDPGLRSVIEWGRNLSAVDLVKAEDHCHDLSLRLVDVFREVRLLLTPTIASLPPLSGQRGVVNGDESATWVSFTYPFNMTRSPAGSVCAGFSDGGLPVGLQIVGPQHGDVVVLRAMAALEAALA